MLTGNGGSAADALHIADELVSWFAFDRPGLSAIALTTDTSIMTAIGNDYGYEKLFASRYRLKGEGERGMYSSVTRHPENHQMCYMLLKRSDCIRLAGNRSDPM